MINNIRKIIRNKLFENLLESISEFENFKFDDSSVNYHHGQTDMHVDMYAGDTLVAYCDYSIFQNKIYINYIESLIKSKGYGTTLMKYLASKYGYENLERRSLTPDGAKMRSRLDKHFNYDFEEHEKKNYKPNILTLITKKHPLVGEFLTCMFHNGYEEAWKKYVDVLRDNKEFDWNDISEIAFWIEGSKANNNPIDEVPPYYVKELVDQLTSDSLNEKTLKENIHKQLFKFIKENDDDIDWDLYDIFSIMKDEVMSEYISALENEKPGPGEYLKARQKWEVVSFSTLQKQWEDFIKYGYVKPNYIRTVENIEKIITQNIGKVNVNTELAGHSQVDPKREWEEYFEGKDITDEYIEYVDSHFGDFIEDSKGQWRLSDYGLDKLNRGLVDLRKAVTPEKKLIAIDHILSIVHMRSDIAGWFVEGGTSSLAALSGINRD